MDSQGYSALAFLKPFDFLPKFLDLEELPSLSFGCVPFPGSLQELFQGRHNSIWQTVEQAACRTYALYPFGSTATWGVIPFALPASIALPLVATGLNVVIKSVLLMCGLFSYKGRAKCTSRKYWFLTGLPNLLTKVVGHFSVAWS